MRPRISAAVGLLSAIVFVSTSAAAWSPLPLPPEADLIRRAPLRTPKTLVPGESMTFEPGRLRYVTVQFTPSEIEPHFRLERVHGGEGVEAALWLQPARLQDGEWIVATGPTETTLRLTLGRDAPETARVAVARLEPREPWMVWEWWQDRLHDWMEAGATGPVPTGGPLPARTRVADEARVAAALLELVGQLEPTDAQRRASRRLGHAMLLRAVQRHREPRTRFYRQSDAVRSLRERPPLVRIDTGEFRHPAWKVLQDIGTPMRIRGPAVVELGLRAVKSVGEPDATTRFRLRVRAGGRDIHDARFSSRAAKRGGEMDEDERDSTSDVGVSYVRAGPTDVVGWRRKTQFWVPPGLHDVQLLADGADVYVDGRIHRPRTHVEDAVRGREDIAVHLAAAREHLSGDDSFVAKLLRMELNAFELRRELSAPRGTTEPARAWLAWRELVWARPDGEALAKLEAWSRDVAVSDLLRAEISWALLARALDDRDHALAVRLARRIRPSDEDRPDRLRARARAILRGEHEAANRWRGFHDLWTIFQRRPYDDSLRRQVQRVWWEETYWDELDAPGGEVMLRPLGTPGKRVSVQQLEGRRALLYALSDPPYHLFTRKAPDRGTRLARLRVATFGAPGLDLHTFSIDGEHYRLLREEPLQYFDFAVEAGRRHRLGAAAGGSVFATVPPEGRAEVPADEVFTPRAAHVLESDELGSWPVPIQGAPRFGRLSIWVEPDQLPERIEIDDGVGEIRHVVLRGLGTEPTRSQWLEIPFHLGPAVASVTVQPRGGTVRAALQIRSPRGPIESEPLDVAVRLPADEDRLERIREISAALARAEQPKLRLERLKLLMSLDEDRLARVDAERLLTAASLPPDELAEVERLHAALLVRLSSRWLELQTPWLRGATSIPLQPAAAVVVDETCARARLDCPDVQTYLSSRGASPSVAAGVMRALYRRGGRHDWLFGSEFASAAIDLVTSDPNSAPAGLAAEAYGVMRDVMSRFGSIRNRGRYFRTARWTRWDSVSLLTKGSFLARFEPPLPPVNRAEFRLPTLDDPTRDAVEHALLGQPWRQEDVFELHAFDERTRRYHIYWSGFLEVERTCIDVRPDLQPDGPTPPCGVTAELSVGDTVRDGVIEGEDSPGQVVTSRWPVSATEDVRLQLRRPDGLKGRRVVTRVRLLRSGRDSRIPARRVRRRVDILPPNQPAYLDVQGPVVLRFDARGVIPGEAETVRLTIDDGPPTQLTIPPIKEPESLMMDQPLTRSVRHVVWLDESRVYRIHAEADGFAMARVALRTDDLDALLSPRGRGWLDTSGEPSEPEAFEAPSPRPFALDLAAGSLATRQPIGASTLAEIEYLNRDRVLLEGDETIGTRRAFLRAVAGGYTRVRDVWLRARLGARVASTSPVAEGHLGVYWRAPWRLRFETEATAYGQRLAGRNQAAARLEAEVTRLFTLAPDWLLLARLKPTGRLQPSDPADPATDPVVYNGYAADHPFTLDDEVGLWYRPFLNLLVRSELRLRHNSNGTIDQFRAALAARPVIESTTVELRYAARVLSEDRDRPRTVLFHDVDLRAALAYWTSGRTMLTLEAWSRLTFAPDAPTVRPRFGISFSAWFSKHGLRHRPASEQIYEDLLEPRYFLD